jgi:hypothetical protein
MLSKPVILALVGVTALVVIVTSLALRPEAPASKGFSQGKAGLRETLHETTLEEALEEGLLEVRGLGDGRYHLSLYLTNTNEDPLAVKIPAGMVLEAGEVQMVTFRETTAFVPPRGQIEVNPPTVSVHLTDLNRQIPFHLTQKVVSELAVLLPYLEKRPDIPVPAVQIAVLALTDNVPLSAVARFRIAAGDSPLGLNTDAYRVHVRYIIQGLQLLQEIGYPLERLALMTDPQLKIESMVDPLSHAEACKFYKIPEEKEWTFWRDHLLTGPLDTRHYALFGIARYFPSTALRMLPEWALKQSLDPVYRESAIRALAQTAEDDALPVLERIAYDLEREPDLAKVAQEMVEVLRNALANPAPFPRPVPFRITNPEVIPLPESPDGVGS